MQSGHPRPHLHQPRQPPVRATSLCVRARSHRIRLSIARPHGTNAIRSACGDAMYRARCGRPICRPWALTMRCRRPVEPIGADPASPMPSWTRYVCAGQRRRAEAEVRRGARPLRDSRRGDRRTARGSPDIGARSKWCKRHGRLSSLRKPVRPYVARDDDATSAIDVGFFARASALRNIRLGGTRGRR
jgi:hypothetical protein